MYKHTVTFSQDLKIFQISTTPSCNDADGHDTGRMSHDSNSINNKRNKTDSRIDQINSYVFTHEALMAHSI